MHEALGIYTHDVHRRWGSVFWRSWARVIRGRLPVIAAEAARPPVPPPLTKNGAQDMALYIAETKAARMRDLKAHVVTAEGKHRALALWDHSRDWDPGD